MFYKIHNSVLLMSKEGLFTGFVFFKLVPLIFYQNETYSIQSLRNLKSCSKLGILVPCIPTKHFRVLVTFVH